MAEGSLDFLVEKSLLNVKDHARQGSRRLQEYLIIHHIQYIRLLFQTKRKSMMPDSFNTTSAANKERIIFFDLH